MDLSMKWLHEFTATSVSPREFSEALTMSGSKVEGYSFEGEEISKVVVGRVDEIVKHPDSDHLVICQVYVGSETIQIVTGAQNLTVGDLVPVALDGSTLPGGIKIKKGKLRGVASCGMMCSLGELGLTLGDFPYAIEDGIFVLQENCKPGDDIKEAIGYNDTVVEFEITSNRADCLSVLGLARETAVTFGGSLTDPQPVVTEHGGNINDMLKVSVTATDLCSRYMARVVQNIRVAPSPRWMRERLRASGVRPINNIVDITNYVMLEYGQPMHAFDYRFVKNGQIEVRRARDGEAITTLDGNERKLNDRMLVIADTEKPIAVAGVMGGEYSGIMDDTTTIVFESACFDGASVRTTAKALGMRTDASSRYEKGLPPKLCKAALERACELITLLDAGDVVCGQIDEAHFDSTPKTVKFDPEWTNRFLGTDISREDMTDILSRLQFTVDGDTVTVPYFRTDIEHKADIAEEIARIYGYNNIAESCIRGSASAKVTDEQKFERTVGNTLLALGYSQIITYSFISPKLYDKVNMPEDDSGRRSVVISNPLGEDTSIMRTTALPSMLLTLATNYNNRNKSAALYEIATEYIPQGDGQLPIERKKIMLGAYGDGVDFFTVKGSVEALLKQLGVEEYDVAADADEYAYHPGRTAKLTVGDKLIGIVGEIHPSVADNFEIGTKTYTAELYVDELYAVRSADRHFSPLPKFPSVTRDIAVICDIDLPVLSLEKAIRTGAGALLESIELFDVYTGAQIPSGKKSVAYAMTLRSDSGTLNDKQSEKVMKKIIAEAQKLGAQLRS